MRLRYLATAQAELRDAIIWYRVRSLAAARHFNEEVIIAEDLLRAHTRIGKRVGKEARSLCVNDFPYSLIYLIESEEIIVVAVAHHSRRPDYWSNRLQEQD